MEEEYNYNQKGLISNNNININNNNINKPLLQNDYGKEEEMMIPSSSSNSGRSGNHRTINGNTNINSGTINSEDKKKFIVLDTFRLTPKRDGWGAVANLDLFFTVSNNIRVYEYVNI